MAEKKEVLRVMTPKGRVAFPQVFSPKPGPDGGNPKYSLTLLFDKDAQKSPEFAKMKELAKKAMTDKWGATPPKGIHNPFKDAGEKEYQGFEAGVVYISPNSKEKPGLVNAQVEDIIDASEFYGGCYARARLTVFAWELKAQNGAVLKRGVSFGLDNIQKIADGEKFTSRTSAKDDFEPLYSEENKTETSETKEENNEW